MSARSAALRAAIEASEAIERPPERLRRRTTTQEDDLPREEQQALRLLVAWPGQVQRSSLGAQLDRAEQMSVGVNGGHHLVRCCACVDGWMRPVGQDAQEYQAAFNQAVMAWAERELERDRRACLASGQEFDEQVAKERAIRVGRERAAAFDIDHPPPGRQKCPICEGSRYVVEAQVPAEHADPQCPLCGGTGRESYVGWSIVSVARWPRFAGRLRVKNSPATRRCHCTAETARETGSSVHGDGHQEPDPEHLWRLGELSHRLLTVEQAISVEPFVRACFAGWIPRPGLGLSLCLQGWYSLECGDRLEYLWPLTEAGLTAVAGLDLQSRLWRAQAKVRKGGEALTQVADRQARVLLKAARRAWMATLPGKDPQ